MDISSTEHAMNQDDEDEEIDTDDPEGPDASDIDDDDAADMQPCPYCGREVYEEAERCPHCGRHISEEDSHSRKPVWFLVAAILGLVAAVIVWLLMSA